MHSYSLNRSVVVAVLVIPLIGTVSAAGSDRYGGGEPALPRPAVPPASQTMIRLARSQDGVSFADTGEVLVRRAAAPDLFVMPSGDVLAMFDHADSKEAASATSISVTRSGDGGKQWLTLRPIRMRGAEDRLVGARHGDLVRLPGGGLRLYFVGGLRTNGYRGDSPATYVLSAVSRNGLDYRLDLRTRIELDETLDAHPVAAPLEGRAHLFVSGGPGQRSSVAVSATRKGRRFSPLRELPDENATLLGSIEPIRGGLRAFGTASDGIRSLFSHDGGRWQIVAGVHIVGGWDPAVARLRDGSYLMAYCTALDETPGAVAQLVPVAADQDDADLAWSVLSPLDGDLEEAWAEAADAEAGDELAATESDEIVPTDETASKEGGGDEAVDEPAETEAIAEADAAGEEVVQLKENWDDDPETADMWLSRWDPLLSDGFAPLPDFKTKVDYYRWYSEYMVGRVEDNAYDLYADFMEGTLPGQRVPPDWPELNDMLNGEVDAGPPGPWDPADHPDWAASGDEAQGLFDKLKEASLRANYAMPPKIGGTEFDALPNSEELLIGLRLSHLGPHRRLNRALLADAWRERDGGKVSSERMLDAWRTTYRTSGHLAQGTTLIEELVSVAERELVRENARWSLQHEVFEGESLGAAFNTLRELDATTGQVSRGVRGEHGFSMDLVQYLFSPPTTDGRPRPNLERAGAVAPLAGIPEDFGERFSRMTSDDVFHTIDTFDRHYRELGELSNIGYPEVRAADIDAFEARHLDASPVTEVLMPALSRVHRIRARSEASRRATQLTYATHLFRQQNGRWPTSLDELPAEYGREMRTDPFTGHNFGYRLTDEGPRIYSLSENGVDDGGAHSPRWDDDTEASGGSDDYVFWPPQPKK